MAAPIIYNPAYLFAHEAGDQYSARYQKPFNHWAAAGYDFVRLIAGLLEEAQPTRQGVKDVMAAGFQYSGVFGQVRLRAGDHDIAHSAVPGAGGERRAQVPLSRKRGSPMKRLGTKLIAGFAFFLVMIVAVGLYSSLAGQASLQGSIGQSSVFVANEMMISMNFTMYNWLDRLEIRATEPAMQAAVRASNREFDAMESVDAYMDRMESAWRRGAEGRAVAGRPTRDRKRRFAGAPRLLLRPLRKERGQPAARRRCDHQQVRCRGRGNRSHGPLPVRRGRRSGSQQKQSGSVAGDVVQDETSGSSVLPLAVRISILMADSWG